MKTRDALRYFNSRRKLADALGISVQAIHLWGDEVPRLRAYELEKITGGVLKVDDAPKPMKRAR